MNQNNRKTTDFGYQQVPVEEKSRLVADIFHRVADNYDLMNDLMSLGIHRLWKHYAVTMSGVKSGDCVLDVAAGSGDLSQLFAEKVGKQGNVWVTDINDSMLQLGRTRLTDAGYLGNINYVQADAECLPFADNYFDCISIAFGLRNVTNKLAALRSMFRCLKPGGRVIILEFSKPLSLGFQKLYDLYSFSVLPMLGNIIANDEQSYRYLAESIRMHPNQEMLKQIILDADFEDCEYRNLCGGIVAIHRAYKY